MTDNANQPSDFQEFNKALAEFLDKWQYNLVPALEASSNRIEAVIKAIKRAPQDQGTILQPDPTPAPTPDQPTEPTAPVTDNPIVDNVPTN